MKTVIISVVIALFNSVNSSSKNAYESAARFLHSTQNFFQ